MSEEKDRNASAGWHHVPAESGAELAPRGAFEARTEGPDNLVPGLVWCVAGAVVSGFIPLLSGFATAYGTCLATKGRGARESLLALAAAVVPAVAVGAVTQASSLMEPVLPAISGFSLGLLVAKRKLRASTLLCAVLGLAAALIATDAVLSYAAGTTLGASIDAMLTAAAAEYGEMAGSSEVQSALEGAIALLRQYWPLAYAAMAAAWCVSAGLGCAMFVHSGPDAAECAVKLRDFDLPIWALVALVATFALTVMDREGMPVPAEVVFWAKNLLQALRVACAIQGIAVAVWFLATQEIGRFGQVLASILCVWLETEFMAMSVVGLVDGLADFRNIARKGLRSYQYRASETK